MSMAERHIEPLVSVVMPAFNAERTVLQAIKSVLNQSVTNIELIVCDDGSSDFTLKVMSEIVDPRLTIVVNTRNLGEGAARDLAIEKAVGDWVAFIDADDAWEIDRLENLLFALSSDTDVMVFDDLMLCHDAGDGLIPWKPLRGKGAYCSKGLSVVELSRAAFLQSRRLLIKPLISRSLIKNNNIVHGKAVFGADTEFFLRIIAAGVRLRYVSKPMYLYRLTPGSATSNPNRDRLMYEAVRSSLLLDGFSQDEKDVLTGKVEQLRKNKVYSDFLACLLALEIKKIFFLLGENLWILPVFLIRGWRFSLYSVDRFLCLYLGFRSKIL